MAGGKDPQACVRARLTTGYGNAPANVVVDPRALVYPFVLQSHARVVTNGNSRSPSTQRLERSSSGRRLRFCNFWLPPGTAPEAFPWRGTGGISPGLKRRPNLDTS